MAQSAPAWTLAPGPGNRLNCQTVLPGIELTPHHLPGQFRNPAQRQRGDSLGQFIRLIARITRAEVRQCSETWSGVAVNRSRDGKTQEAICPPLEE